MGLGDRIKGIGEGVKDIFAGPLGLPWDMARAVSSNEYNPGLGGIFTDALGRTTRGVANVSENIGLSAIGRGVSEATPIDDWFKTFLDQMELAYNTEFQLQTNRSPLGLDRLGVEPGTVSISRLGATTLGATAAALPGGEPITQGVFRAWERSRTTTPGRATVDNLFGVYSRTPEEQDRIRGGIAYNFASGTIDAASRWYLQPEILAGKGIKKVRAHYNPTPLKMLQRAQTVARGNGYKVAELLDEAGEAVTRDGAVMMQLKGAKNKAVYHVTRRSQLGAKGSSAIDEVALHPDLSDAGIHFPGSDEIPGAPSRGAGEPLAEGAIDLDAPVSNTITRPQDQGLILHGENDLAAAKRYAADLHRQNPNDPVVIVKINADGLPVVFDDFSTPTPGDSAFMTMADEITDQNILEIIDPDISDLEIGDVIPDHLNPQSKLDARLYNPDGTAVEPGDVVPWQDIADDFLTASRLYSEGGSTLSEKYLRSRARERALAGLPQSSNPIDIVMNSKVVQQALNRMDGMSADELRRQFFPDNPYGQALATYLSEAKSYGERRTILAASMGFKLPEFNNLAEVARTRLRLIMEEQERLKKGLPPDEKFQAMLGLESRFADVPAAEVDKVWQELIEETGETLKTNAFLDSISDAAPVQDLKIPVNRRVGAAMRQTNFYQAHPLARPIRTVVEMKPHQWVNVKDPMADIQLVRQLEEAAPLGISAAEVSDLRARFMASTNDQAKVAIMIEAEGLIIERAAKMANLTPAEFNQLVNASRQGRSRVSEYLNSRRYAPNGRDRIRNYDAETGELTETVMPMLSTQTASFVPLADIREIRKHTSRIRELKAAGVSVPKEIMDSFTRLWKPSVLLRGGWMLRVVSDEQLRILAKTGSLLKHLAAIESGEMPKFVAAFDPKISAGQRAGEAFGTVSLTRPITAATARVSAAIARGAAKLKLVDPEYYELVKGVGLESAASSRASFGGPTETALQDLQGFLGRDESTFLDHMFTKSTGQWQTVSKGDRLYGPSWLRALNNQMGADPLVQNILETILSAKGGDWSNDVYTNAKKFLNTTDEGRIIAERMPWRSADPDKWVEDVVETLNYYTGGMDENLLRRMKDKRVRTKDLEAIDEAFRPATVHGEVLDQTLGKSPINVFLKDMMAQSFDVMGRLPTDTLSRQPFFKQLYADRMIHLRRIHEAQGLEMTEQVVQRMNTSARGFALNQTKKYLYDLAEVSRFGDMMRFAIPFYSAWQEVLKVWGGIALKDPSVIGKGMQIWQAPNKAGMVFTDDDGEEYIQLRLSEKTADKLNLTGWGKYVATGGVRLGKGSFNLILNNPLPGAGPLIQYPVNEAVKRAPELEESLRWLLPYGVSANSLDILSSPLVRQFASELAGPQNDRSYQRAFIDAITYMDNLYRRGERSDPPTLEEAHQIAGKIRVIRGISRLVSPAQPIFDSPLQPYVEIYRDLIDNLGPDKADEVFLNEFGDEFFAVTLSRTISKTGLPASVESEVARRQFEDIINRFPEYGRLIVGDQALGEFSTAAFAAQLERPVNPDDPFSEMERVYRQVELDPNTGTVMEVDRRLGWQEYINMMDMIELHRKKMGLPNLRVKEAEGLNSLKRQVTSALAQKYPSWWEDFNQRDDLKWDKRIAAFATIVKDMESQPLLYQDRVDLQGLKDYLDIRQQVQAELNRRKLTGGSATLEATSNQDLLNLWSTAVNFLLEDNIAFAPLYFRYLENDPVRIGRG